VLDALDADPRLVFLVPLAPAQLPALVENTPVIAFEVLLRLMCSRRMGGWRADVGAGARG
jgi:hypothetical protein